MELNQPASPEKSDPAVSSSPDERGPSPARTYECTFCKRGFSNAQALGGHMNIHRKDKAKLKRATSIINEFPPQQFLEIPKNSPTLFTPPLISTNPPMADFQDTRLAANWTWNFSASEDDATSRCDQGLVGELKQLPLFTETAASRHENSKQQPGQKESLLSSSSADDHELDLELRLGKEPPSESSSTSKGTRKFF